VASRPTVWIVVGDDYVSLIYRAGGRAGHGTVKLAPGVQRGDPYPPGASAQTVRSPPPGGAQADR